MIESFIKHITDVSCPTCGSPRWEESVQSTHVNGQQFEQRGFRCGCVVGWVPNFERQETYTKCPHSKEALERRVTLNRWVDKVAAALADDIKWNYKNKREIERVLEGMME